MTDRKHNNLLDRTRLHSDKPSFAHLIEMNSVSLSFLLAPAQHPTFAGGRRSEATMVHVQRLRVNVKRGDFSKNTWWCNDRTM